jgi:hypothetical protein
MALQSNLHRLTLVNLDKDRKVKVIIYTVITRQKYKNHPLIPTEMAPKVVLTY